MCSKPTKMSDAMEALFPVTVEEVRQMNNKDGNAHIVVL